MKVGLRRRLRMVYAFWKALGDKDRNSVIALVHECGYVRIASGDMPVEAVRAMETGVSSARGYDHGS